MEDDRDDKADAPESKMTRPARMPKNDQQHGAASDLAFVFGENQRNVLSAETEAVGQRPPHGSLAGHVGHVVEVALRVGRLIIDASGGRTSSRIAKRQVIASTLPAAAIKWPIMLLMLEIGMSGAAGPQACLMAIVSTRSLTIVLVPWALM